MSKAIDVFFWIFIIVIIVLVIWIFGSIETNVTLITIILLLVLSQILLWKKASNVDRKASSSFSRYRNDLNAKYAKMNYGIETMKELVGKKKRRK